MAERSEMLAESSPRSLPGEGNERREARLVLGAILAFALLLLVPLGLFEGVPSDDGPAHFETASTLWRIAGDAEAPERAFYRLDARPMPNWVSTALAMALEPWVGPLVGEKLIVAGLVLGLPLALLFLLRGIDRRASFLAAACLPLVYSYLTYMGFYGFLYGTIFLLLFLGAYWRWRDALGPRRVAALLALALLVYLAHPIPAVLSWLSALTLAAWLALLELRREAGRGLSVLAVLGRRMLPPLVALAPSMVLLALFLGQSRGGERVYWELARKLRAMLGADVIVAHQAREIPIALATALLLGALLLAAVGTSWPRWRRGALRSGDGWVLVALAWVACCLVAPDHMAGGAFIVRRMILLALLALMPVLALGRYPGWARAGTVLTGGLLALGLVALQAPAWRATDGARATFLAAAEHVERGSTFAPVFFTGKGRAPDGSVLSRRTSPSSHLGSIVAMERDAINLFSYQARTDHFPIAYRDLNHHDLLYAGRWPTRLDLDRYLEHAGELPRYLLLWCIEEQCRDAEELYALHGYRRIATAAGAVGDVRVLEQRTAP